MRTLIKVLVVLLSATAVPCHAELGKGIIENADGTYRRGVHQDWQEGIVLNPATGNYAITYKNYSDSFSQVIYEPATKISPRLRSRFKPVAGSPAIRYEYGLKNDPAAQQPVGEFMMHVSNVNPGSPIDPPGWNGAAIPGIKAGGLRLTWAYFGADLLTSNVAGLAPGASVRGFALESNDLPGVVPVQLRGEARTTTWLGGPPETDTPVGRQLYELEEKNFVARTAAAPKIGNPVPFNAVVVLTNIQAHVKTDIAPMQLIDPALLTVIDRGLTQAIAAAQAGNTPSLLHEIKSLRQLLKQEHADVDQDNDGDDDDKKPKPRIDKLAAKVLDFNLKYVGLKMTIR